MTEVFLFAKAPRSGFVKTRLASEVGDDAAVRVYRTIGLRVVRQIAPVSNITVWYDPPDALSDMRSWLGDWAYREQPRGDLGTRLSHAFATHFARPDAGPVIAIGADAPGVDAGSISRAAELLRTVEVVVGPTEDGGYYLIGLAHPCPALFTEIPWGTEKVFETTKVACEAAGLSITTLPVLRDVDRAEDLVALGLGPLTD